MLHYDDTKQKPENSKEISSLFSLKQVELNTIAAALFNLSTRTHQLHKFVVERFPLKEYDPKSLPYNPSMEQVCNGIAKAHQLYNNSSAFVVMIVHGGEFNMFDQRWLDFNLWDRFQIKMLRYTLNDFGTRGSLDSQHQLVIDGNVISVVYYRAGYAPTDYPTEAEWSGRLIIERSKAIKCPSVAYHLIGTKKIQQLMVKPGMLERFLNDKQIIEELRASFMGLYSLTEGEETTKYIEERVQEACAHPNRYVLKPEREGGGNNLYGSQMVKALQTMTSKERSFYILMERIMAPISRTYTMRDQVVSDN